MKIRNHRFEDAHYGSRASHRYAMLQHCLPMLAVGLIGLWLGKKLLKW
jgi:hypothetical protein